MMPINKLVGNPWAIIDRCTIMKGEGVFDFDELIARLSEQVGPNGNLLNFPIGDMDIAGQHLIGVEADAVEEAIFDAGNPAYGEPEDHLTMEEAAMIRAGPREGNEAAYKALLQKAINVGGKIINHAVKAQNDLWAQKRQEAAYGSNPETALTKIPVDLPLPFEGERDLTLVPQWRNGVWGEMNKDQPYVENLQTGVADIRIGNRGQSSLMPESHARPYHEGLQFVRELHGYTGKTSETIGADKVRHNSVYIDHDTGRQIQRLISQMGQQGIPATPENIRHAWLNDPELRNVVPQHMKDIRFQYGIRQRGRQEQGGVAQPTDVAQQAVEASQQMPESPAEALSNWFAPEDFKTKHGRDMWGSMAANARTYIPQGLNSIMDMYEVPADMRPSLEEVMGMGSGRAQRQRMTTGAVAWLQANNIRPRERGAPAEEPPVEQPPVEQPPQEGAPAGGLGALLEQQLAAQGRSRERQEARPDPPAPPQPQPEPQPEPQPAVQPEPPAPPVPVQEAPPPVPRQGEVAPAPVGQVPPNIPPQEPPQRLNANQVRPSRDYRQDGPPQHREGWRGMADRLAHALGRGAGHLGNIFGKEEIEVMLEDVQCQIALQDENITKSITQTTMVPTNASHLALAAGKVGRPVTDVVAILNSRGDWREMSKAMDIPLNEIQIVKVMFHERE